MTQFEVVLDTLSGCPPIKFSGVSMKELDFRVKLWGSLIIQSEKRAGDITLTNDHKQRKPAETGLSATERNETESQAKHVAIGGN